MNRQEQEEQEMTENTDRRMGLGLGVVVDASMDPPVSNNAHLDCADPSLGAIWAIPTMAGLLIMEHAHSYIRQPTAKERLPADRPIVKLSVSLVDTYKHINQVFYEKRNERRAARKAQKGHKEQTTMDRTIVDKL
jgi:hypothetical protein